MTERQYWVAFSYVKGIGPVRLRHLLTCFGSLQAAWNASRRELAEAGLDRRTLDSVFETRRRIDPATELARLDKLGIGVLTWEDEDYPPLLAQLRSIDHAPPVVYLRGSLAEQDSWAVSIVGTRSVTAYGRQVAFQLSRDLAASGLTIVSGLARGVDCEAHQAALDAGGRTIAILPCGLDMVYPPEHRQLAARIIRQGAVMSIFPLGTKPLRTNFSARNRVLSGLGLGTLVVEAGDKSGALMTAGYALEQGREVFAVPGNITAQGSSGTNHLIQDGATPVLSVRDVLEALNLTHVAQYSEARAALPDMTNNERAVLESLSQEPWHIDEVTRSCGLPVSVVSSALVTLELKGMVRQVGPMTYVKNI